MIKVVAGARRGGNFLLSAGRRWPKGSDEGATLPDFGELAPSSRCRGLLPGGEKKQAAANRLTSNTNGLNQPLSNIRQRVEETLLSAHQLAFGRQTISVTLSFFGTIFRS